MIITASDIGSVLLGPSWQPSVLVLRLLAVYVFMRMLDEDLLSIYMAVRRPAIRTRAWIMIAVVTVLVVPIGTVGLGLAGAVLAITVAMSVGVGQQLRKTREFVTIDWQSTFITPLLLGGAVLMLASWLVTTLPNLPTMAALLVKGAGVSVLYLLALVSVDGRETQSAWTALRQLGGRLDNVFAQRREV